MVNRLVELWFGPDGNAERAWTIVALVVDRKVVLYVLYVYNVMMTIYLYNNIIEGISLLQILHFVTSRKTLNKNTRLQVEVENQITALWHAKRTTPRLSTKPIERKGKTPWGLEKRYLSGAPNGALHAGKLEGERRPRF